jgi:hypothetical protein
MTPPPTNEPNSGEVLTSASGSTVHYLSGQLVRAGDVITIHNARCTARRIISDRYGRPCQIACKIDGCGEIDHCIYIECFQRRNPTP